MSALDAAVTLGKASGWSLSNLQIHKLLYIAQMFHMGKYDGAPIFAEDFQAWKLGPVIPGVYQRAKIYGSEPVASLFHQGELRTGSTTRDMVLEVYNGLPDKSAWKLVSITHWEKGAWAKHYRPQDGNSVIPKADILNEYRARNP